MKTIGYFSLAATFEIAGCFSFWWWIREQRSAVWSIPGVISLAIFALLLTRAESAYAGRAYAAYGGIYIVASLIWLWAIEHTVPDRYDLIGALLCISGASVILLARTP